MRWPRVLMYHAFGAPAAGAGADPHALFVTDDALRAQLSFLHRRGWRPLDLSGFLDGLPARRWPSRAFLVTSDDGHRSVATLGGPLLREYGVPFVSFMLSGLVGGTTQWIAEMPDEPLCDEREWSLLQRQGAELALHSWDHRDMSGLTPAELHQQVDAAAAAFADVAGHAPRAFAYPRGVYDDAGRAAVRQHGFGCAFAVHAGHLGDRWTWPRVDVTSRDTVRALQVKLMPGYLGVRRHRAGRVLTRLGGVLQARARS